MPENDGKVLDELKVFDGGYDIMEGAKPDQKIKLGCAACRTNTLHKVVASVLRHDWTEEEQYTNIYQTVQCCGCETVSFYHTTWLGHEAEIDPDSSEWEAVVRNHQYPGTVAMRDVLSGRELLPETLRSIYDQGIFALNHDQRILAGFALRGVVEAACADKGMTKSSLSEMLSELEEQGLISKAKKGRLHLVRELGNSVVHEMKTYPMPTLLNILKEVNHLLEELYVRPHDARGLLDLQR